MKEKKVTIYDIAAAAGVSTGTVNRALNGKERISPQTKELVLRTAEALGYRANVAAQGLRRTPITLGAVVFCPIDEYVDDIVEGMEAAAKSLEKYRVSVDIRKLAFTTGKACIAQTAALLRSFAEQQYRGVVLFLSARLDEMEEIGALIEELGEAGISVATVANDLSHTGRVIHVGVDAHMAGNMAAEMLSLSCHGEEVAVMVASKASPVNREYIRGFEDYAARGVFSGVHIYEHADERERVVRVTEQMLRENPQLKGVYMATASSAVACEYLRKHGPGHLSVITTDLLRQTPALLRQRVATAVIFQNPYKQGKNVVRTLYHYITEQQTTPSVQYIAPQILLSSNLSAYLYGERDGEKDGGESDA